MGADTDALTSDALRMEPIQDHRVKVCMTSRQDPLRPVVPLSDPAGAPDRMREADLASNISLPPAPLNQPNCVKAARAGSPWLAEHWESCAALRNYFRDPVRNGYREMRKLGR